MATEISRTATIDTGHRVTNHSSKCRNPHGHTYKLELFASAEELQTNGSSEGMVADFSVLKTLLEGIDKVFDHGFCVWVKDVQLINAFGLGEYRESFLNKMYVPAGHTYIDASGLCGLTYIDASGLCPLGKVIVLPFVPTVENLAKLWLEMCRSALNMLKMLDTDNQIVGVTITKIRVWETPNCSCEVF